MICVVSTIKDSIANVTHFVEGNLAAGADHLFIFVEGGDREVLEFLDKHPHVTAVDADEVHSHVPQPSNLNARQTINANRITYLLADLDSAEWLFHIDGDECLDLDKERLLALGPEVQSVRLLPKESVSSSAPEHAGYFKRLLTQDELALLVVLGLIDKPNNRDYFHGHVSGKIGIRPSTEVGLHIHDASLIAGGSPEYFGADWLSVLHYDSLTPEEFLRKWSVHVAAKSPPSFRGQRKLVHGAMSSLTRNDHLDDDQRHGYMLEVYRRQLEDDVPTLRQLGLLEREAQRGYTPADSFTKRETKVIARLLPQLCEANVRYFQPRKVEHDPAELMASAHGSLHALGRWRPGN